VRPVLRIVLVLVVVVAGGCAGAADDGRTTVVASFFPLAEVAREVGGSDVHVRDLTPPGAEPHDLELRTRDVEHLLDADLAIVLGGDFQPGVERVAKRRDLPTITVLEHRVPDPHVWLDPTALIPTVREVGKALHRPARAQRLEAELRSLDRELRDGLAGCRGRTIVVAHAAFGHFAGRYGLRQAPIAGLEPEEETDPRTVDRLVELVRREHVRTVFAEKLLSPAVVRTLAREADVDVAVLDPLESGRPGTYASAIRHDLRTIRHGLRC
jgi:zinc transport system substrate-binding protein